MGKEPASKAGLEHPTVTSATEKMVHATVSPMPGVKKWSWFITTWKNLHIFCVCELFTLKQKHMRSTGRNDNAFKLHGANIPKLFPLTTLLALKKHCTYETKDSANIQLAFQDKNYSKFQNFSYLLQYELSHIIDSIFQLFSFFCATSLLQLFVINTCY